MSKYLIYALKDPRTGRVRYVGRSSSGVTRAKAHANPCWLARDTHLHKTRWVQSLVDLGMVPEIDVLEAVEDPADLNSAEQFWVAHLRANGADLTNLTDGGFGLHGRKHSAETREKQSKAATGRRLTPETVAKIVATKRARGQYHVSDAAREKLRVANTGRAVTPEWRAKIAAGHRGKKKTRGIVVDSCGEVYASVAEAARALRTSSQSISAAARTGRVARGRTLSLIEGVRVSDLEEIVRCL